MWAPLIVCACVRKVRRRRLAGASFVSLRTRKSSKFPPYGTLTSNNGGKRGLAWLAVELERGADKETDCNHLVVVCLVRVAFCFCFFEGVLIPLCFS